MTWGCFFREAKPNGKWALNLWILSPLQCCSMAVGSVDASRMILRYFLGVKSALNFKILFGCKNYTKFWNSCVLTLAMPQVVFSAASQNLSYPAWFPSFFWFSATAVSLRWGVLEKLLRNVISYCLQDCSASGSKDSPLRTEQRGSKLAATDWCIAAKVL